MLSPSPVPPRWRLSWASAWAKRSNTRAWNAGGMPGPSSVTLRRAQPGRCARPTVTVLPDGVNLIAFDSRLLSTCTRRSWSIAACTPSAPGGRSSRSVTPAWRAWPSIVSVACRSTGASGCTLRRYSIWPASIFWMSSRSFTIRIRRSQLWLAMWISLATSGGRSPAMPASSSDSEAWIEVSGVRSSCETVDTNSLFMRSTFLRSEMSCRKMLKKASAPSPASATVVSTVNSAPWRLTTIRSRRRSYENAAPWWKPRSALAMLAR